MAVFARYWEGGNRNVLVAVPITLSVVLADYRQVACFFHQAGVDQQLVYSYSFNLFAIMLGALVSLFALLASKPTEFLVRLRNTLVLRLLLGNIKASMLICCLTLLMTFLIGVANVQPSLVLDNRSALFLLWASASVATLGLMFRTVRSVFIALTSNVQPLR